MVDLTLRGQYQEAQRLVHTNQYREAMTVCRRVLGTFPKHVGTYGVVGQLCLALGEHEVAANLFRRVLSADPEHALSYASLGAVYEERGLLDEAAWQFQRAFELSPGNREFRRELSELLGEAQLSNERRLKTTRAGLARIYLRGRLYAKAIGELRTLAADEPHRFDVRIALAEALWTVSKRREAEVVCQGILAQLPNCLKANLILGQIWLASDRDDQARALLQCAQSLDPENATAQVLFGSRSPLPPRMARLPVAEDDMPPLDLPYLSEGGVVESEKSIIDGSAPSRPANGPRQLVMGSANPQLPPAHMTPSSVAEPFWPHLGVDAAISPAVRLKVARRLCNMGALGQALAHYERLLAEDPQLLEQVAQDLHLQNLIHPGTSRLVNLLARVRPISG